MIKVGDYTLYQLLGKGSFGEVYLTQKANSSQILATKKLDKKQTDKPSVKKYFDNEISIMKESIHPNIVRFYDMVTSYSHYYVVMEYCNGGGLSKCLYKYKKLYNHPFTQEIVQYLMRQIIEGLKFIHSRKIIHRDIKLDNILVKFSNENDKKSLNMLASEVKIIDFGLATRLGPKNLTFTALGSPINMDPLILKKYNKAGGYEQLQGYNEKADIWSLGTVCYEMLTGEALFKVKDIKELMMQVEKGTYTIPFNLNFSKEAVSFLNAMLQYNGDNRLSAEQLANHDFITKNVNEFSKVDLNTVYNKIDGNGLQINVKQNQTIWSLFNDDNSKETNQLINQNKYNNQNIQNQQINNQKGLIEKRRNMSEQNYVFSNNIYNYNKNNNNNENKQNNIQTFNAHNIAHRRATEGNIPQTNFVRLPININNPLNDHKYTEANVSPEKNIERRFEIEKKKMEKQRIEKEKKKMIENLKNENIKKELDKKNNEQSEKEKEKVKKYMGGLLEEYRAAKEYFKENDLKNQEEDANQKFIQIKNSIMQFDKGVPIDPNNIPKPITPEYIHGCSEEERKTVFKEVLSKYEDDKNDLETKIKDGIYKLKQLGKDKLAKIKGAIMPKLESEKTKLDKIKKIIEGIEDRFKHKWAPPPKITKEYEGEQNNKSPTEGPIYKLKIHIGRTDYKKDNLVLNALIKISEDKILSKEVKLKKEGDYDEDIILDLNSKEWSNIENYRLILEYYYTNAKEKNLISLNISKIKDNNLLFECPVNLYAENITIKISVSISLIKPEENINLDQGKKQIIYVKKIYPPFNGKSPETKVIPFF